MKLASKSQITKGTLGGKPFLFNPTSFQDTTTINYTEVKTCGMSYPAFSYSGGSPRTVTFEIYLNDKVEKGITRSFISHLRNYLPPERKTGYQFKSPKPIVFSFGWFVKECYLNVLDINYQAFSRDLQPIKAVATVTLIIIQ